MPRTDASASPNVRRLTETPDSDGSVHTELSEGTPSASVKSTKEMEGRKGMQVLGEYAAKGLVINEFDEVCCSLCHRGPLHTAEHMEEHVQLHEQMNNFSEARWKKHGFQIAPEGKLGCTWCPEGPFDTPLQAFKHINSPFHKRNAPNVQGTHTEELTDEYGEDGITVINGVGFCVCGAGPFFFACHIDVHVRSAKHLKFWRKMDEVKGIREPDNVVLRNEHNMFVCAKCHIAVQTEEAYMAHLLGQRHRRACAATAEEPVEMLPEWGNEGIVRTERGVFCTKCDKVLHTKEDVAVHVSGRTHNRKNSSFFGIVECLCPYGYAFVNSRDASAKYGTGDVFVPAALVAMERLSAGDSVWFSLDALQKIHSTILVVNYIEVCNRHQVRNEEIQRFDGVIKSFCEENGYGFISCPSLKEKYSRDVFVNFKQIPSELRHVGQRVSFEVTMNKHGHPQAQKVEDATVQSAATVVPPQTQARPGDPYVKDGVYLPQESSHHQHIPSSNCAPPTEPDSRLPAPTTPCASVEKPTTAETILMQTASSTLNVSEFSSHTADINKKEDQAAQIKTHTPAHISLSIDEEKRVVHPLQQSQVDGRALPRPLAPPVPKGPRVPAVLSSVSSTGAVSRVLPPAPAVSSKVVLPEDVPRVTPPRTPTRSATSSCSPSPASATPTPATVAIPPLPRPSKVPDSVSRPTTASSAASGLDKEDFGGTVAQSSDDDNISKAERKRLKKERKQAKKLKKEEKRRTANDVRDDGSVSVVSTKDKKRAKEHARERHDAREGWTSPRSLHSTHIASAASSDWAPRSTVEHGDAMASSAPPKQRLAGMEDLWRAPSLYTSGTPASGSTTIGSVCAPRSEREHTGAVTQREETDFHKQKTSERVASNVNGETPEGRVRELRPTVLDVDSKLK